MSVIFVCLFIPTYFFILVCAFPFLLGFSENAIEIRLLVNGNLVHTLCVPGIHLITSKVSSYLFVGNVIIRPSPLPPGFAVYRHFKKMV